MAGADQPKIASRLTFDVKVAFMANFPSKCLHVCMRVH